MKSKYRVYYKALGANLSAEIEADWVEVTKNSTILKLDNEIVLVASSKNTIVFRITK